MEKMFWLALGLMLVGCGAQPGSQSLRAVGSPASAVSANSCPGNGLSSKITSLVGSDSSFRQVVGNLIAVSMNPEELGAISGSVGSISGSTGVSMSMALVFDSSHQIISGSSTFKISIRDSLVGKIGTDGAAISTIDIVHSTQSRLSGSYDPSQKILHLVYSDSYGSISVDGQTLGNSLNGQVQFANSVAWDGSTPRRGTLGAFQASSCSFQ